MTRVQTHDLWIMNRTFLAPKTPDHWATRVSLIKEYMVFFSVKMSYPELPVFQESQDRVSSESNALSCASLHLRVNDTSLWRLAERMRLAIKVTHNPVQGLG